MSVVQCISETHGVIPIKFQSGKTDYHFKNVADDIKRILNDKKVVAYPSYQGKEEDISNVKSFVENMNRILVTKRDYFDGCEAPNIVYLSYYYGGNRNYLLRGVENLICVQLMNNYDLGSLDFNGMKVDTRFFDDYYDFINGS